MGEREGYEVLRLIEHNQKCYISSDYVEGKSLIQINWSAYISAGETLVTSM